MDLESLHRILVVDDEEVFRQLLRKTLSLDGFDVDCAADGREALLCLRQKRYGVVITDLMMPRAGGLDVLQAAKAADPDAAVVVITGYASLDSALAAIREGACDYIRKPFQLEEIRSTVKKAFERRRGLAESAAQLEDLRLAYDRLSALLENRSELSDEAQQITEDLEKRQTEIMRSRAAAPFVPGRDIRRHRGAGASNTFSSPEDIRQLEKLLFSTEG